MIERMLRFVRFKQNGLNLDHGGIIYSSKQPLRSIEKRPLMTATTKKPDDRLAVVFISDLHLHPEASLITARFNRFIEWAAQNTKVVYILGDFFHAWAGDDSIDSWSKSIAKRLFWLSQQQVTIYFMHGNRDFLLGKAFADLAGMIILPEPAIIQLGDTRILLVHGDRYCTNDKGHQWFRRLTRNRWFSHFFLRFPYKVRAQLVSKIRQHSQTNRSKPYSKMDVVVSDMIEHMQKYKVANLIHGHTHKPGLINHCYNEIMYSQYVLSDWDDNPMLLCYDESIGIFFNQLELIEVSRYANS